MFVILLIILFFTLIAYLYYDLTKKQNYWKKKGVKYIKPVPFFGNMLPLITKKCASADFIKNLYDAFPDERYCGMFQFDSPVLLLRDPDLIKQISIKYFDHFTDHTGFVNDIDPYWARNLFAVKGERWRDLRHTMSPVFTSSKMKNMFVLMEDCIKQFVDYFQNEIGSGTLEIEMQEMFKRFTMDVIAATAFGFSSNSLKNPDNDFLNYGKDIMNLTGIRRLTFMLGNSAPWLAKFLNLKLISDRNANFFQSIIDRTIKSREEQNIIRPDLIHLLMMARQEKLSFEQLTSEETIKTVNGTSQFLTNQDIAAQAIVFIVGGFDTVSYLLSFTAYELAVNPDVQEKLRSEIKSTWTENITYEMVNGMKYLDMVINESLRKWAENIFADRVCTKQFEIPAEKEGEPSLTLNVGDIVWFLNYGLSHDPKYFPDPEKFDPERFNDENKHKIHPCTFNPFGIGPRSCLGSRFAIVEAKLLFCYFLKHFEFVPTRETKIPPELSKDTAFVAPVGGFVLGLKRL